MGNTFKSGDRVWCAASGTIPDHHHARESETTIRCAECGRGCVAIRANGMIAHHSPLDSPPVTSDQLLSAVDLVVSRNNSRSFTAEDVADALTRDSERWVPAETVRRLLRDLPHEVVVCRIGNGVTYNRPSPDTRAAWREADELAAKLGGEPNHYAVEGRPATIELTLAQARELSQKLTQSPLSREDADDEPRV